MVLLMMMRTVFFFNNRPRVGLDFQKWWWGGPRTPARLLSCRPPRDEWNSYCWELRNPELQELRNSRTTPRCRPPRDERNCWELRNPELPHDSSAADHQSPPAAASNFWRGRGGGGVIRGCTCRCGGSQKANFLKVAGLPEHRNSYSSGTPELGIPELFQLGTPGTGTRNSYSGTGTPELQEQLLDTSTAMASGDHKVEKELARREHRTELEGESRRDLQLLAKQYCIPANIKSNKIIDEILRVESVTTAFRAVMTTRMYRIRHASKLWKQCDR